MKLQNTHAFTLVMPAKLFHEFKALAYSKGMTVSEYLRAFMRKEIKEQKKGMTVSEYLRVFIRKENKEQKKGEIYEKYNN